MNREPGYLALFKTGEIQQRVRAAQALLESCRLCPRQCGANRLGGQKGGCRTTREAVVASYGPHYGEEAPLVGRYGSGTIFFSHCNMECLFCQNHTISQMGEGRAVGSDELSGIMLALQDRRCHNINLVSPTHVVPQILEAVLLAVPKGFVLPLVYNSGGYDSVETLRLLDGIIDIYMPDMKYSDPEVGLRYSGVTKYPMVNRAAVKEMHRQVGDLEMDKDGVAVRGLLVRHLVLPNGLAGTKEVVRFLAQEVSLSTYINIMDQYHPCHEAFQIPQLSRPSSRQEHAQAVDLARLAGLTRFDRGGSLPARFLL